MVDFPLAESPVNQIVRPRCLRRALRSGRVREGCHVILLCGGSGVNEVTKLRRVVRKGERTYVAIGGVYI